MLRKIPYTASPFATVRLELTPLRILAKGIDDDLRRSFPAAIRYGNATANYEHIDGVNIYDVDLEKTMKNPEHRQALDKLAKELISNEILYRCNDTIALA